MGDNFSISPRRSGWSGLFSREFLVIFVYTQTALMAIRMVWWNSRVFRNCKDSIGATISLLTGIWHSYDIQWISLKNGVYWYNFSLLLEIETFILLSLRNVTLLDTIPNSLCIITITSNVQAQNLIGYSPVLGRKMCLARWYFGSLSSSVWKHWD